MWMDHDVPSWLAGQPFRKSGDHAFEVIDEPPIKGKGLAGRDPVP